MPLPRSTRTDTAATDEVASSDTLPAPGAALHWDTDRFLRYLTAVRQVSPHTAEAYARDLLDFQEFLEQARPTAPARRWSEVDYATLRRFLAHLNRRAYQRSTIARKLSAVRALFRFLVDEGLMAHNPAELVAAPKRARHLPEYLHDYELDELLDAPDPDTPDGQRDRALLELLYATGMRLAEVHALNVESVDFERREIRVIGKRNKERVVLFGAAAAAALATYLQYGRPALLAHRRGEGQERALFLSRFGRRLSRSRIQGVVRKHVLRTASAPRISPHALRHTFATHMLDGGADLRALQELLGHASLETTGLYAHVTAERLRESVDRAHPLSGLALPASPTGKQNNEEDPHTRR